MEGGHFMASALALHGGAPAITLAEDGLNWPLTGEAEIAAIADLVRRGELSISPLTRQFEEEFRTFIGRDYALATNNGTSAGHSAFFALGPQPGDEVICPSFTYWASVVQVLNLGGVPVFAEIEPESLNIDPADIEHRITPRTRAIVAVHLLGRPCEMDPILAIARQHDLIVIEDCSHAHGAKYRGRMIGSLGHMAFFSFQTSKLMVGGEGGMLLTDNLGYYERAAWLGHYERIPELSEAYRKYHRTGLGFKYRIHPLAAAIALVQLQRLEDNNIRRRENLEYFLDGLRPLRCWKIPRTPSYMERTHYGCWIHYDREGAKGVPKERVIEALQAEGAKVRDARYNLLHQQPIFREAEHYELGGAFSILARCPNKPLYAPDALPVSEAVRRSLVSVPTFPAASRELLDQYVAAFRKVGEHLEEL
jgi:perosamine synthetase